MLQQPLVSIVTPSYNQGQFIEETIQSVLNQTYKNIQYIIIDGGSSDDTMAVVDKYRDQIDIVIHEKDRGQSDAINKGFRLSKGELIGWINSDDVLYPKCVEEIVRLYELNSDGSIYYTATLDWIDKKSKVFRTVNVNIKNRNTLLNNNYNVIQPGSFYSGRILKDINYVNDSIHYCMDLDLWLRLSSKGPIYAVPNIPYCGFRIWEDSKTSTGREKFLFEILDVLRKHSLSFFSRNNYKIHRDLLSLYVKRVLSLNK